MADGQLRSRAGPDGKLQPLDETPRHARCRRKGQKAKSVVIQRMMWMRFDNAFAPSFLGGREEGEKEV